MDERTVQSILDRLEKTEGAVAGLQLRVAGIDSELAALREERAESPPAVSVPPAPVFCPHCKGGNPRQARVCMWCGQTMPLPEFGPQVPAAPPPVEQVATVALAQAPTPITPIFVPKTVGIEYHLRRMAAPPSPGKRRAKAQVLAAAQAVTLTPAAATIVPAPPIPLPTMVAIAPTAEVSTPVPQKPAAQKPPVDFLGRSEFWINKVGIGLLLLGLAFFFKYSIDRGWLNEQVRVVLGLALGTTLLGFGLAMHRERRHFSQVLLGGSIATYYITGFAAYQMLHIVPYEWAFAFMVGVTALAFALSVRQDEAMLSLVGVAGGLLTPFVLYRPTQGVTGLMIYTCVVLAGASSIYLYKGWRSLLWLAYVGGWAVFATGYLGTVWAGNATGTDRWAMQAAAAFSLLAMWAVPVLREVLYARDPDGWPRPPLIPGAGEILSKHVYVLAIGAPLITLGFSRLVWGSMVSATTWGWLTIAGAAVYAGVAWAVRRELPLMAYVHAMMSILLLTLGVVQILQGNALMFALAAEATALHILSRRLSDRGTATYGYIIWLGLASWLAPSIALTVLDNPGITPGTLTQLAIIALMSASSFFTLSKIATLLYRNYVHFAVLLWSFAQLIHLEYGLALAMIAWAVYAVALTLIYHRWPASFGRGDTMRPAQVIFGFATLLFAIECALGHSGEWVVFNLKTALDALYIAAAVTLSFTVTPRNLAPVYRIAAHFAVLALLARELLPLDYGQSYALVAIALYLTAAQYLCRRTADHVTSFALHLPYALLVVWLVDRMYYGRDELVPFFSIGAVANLAVITCAACISFMVRTREEALVYRVGVYIGLLGWLWQELHGFANGMGYVILAWSACAVLLHYLARRVTDRDESLAATVLADATFVLAGIVLAQRLLLQDAYQPPVLNIAALTDALVIGLAVAAWYLRVLRKGAQAYLWVAHLAVLVLLWRELIAFDSGNAYVSIAWGAYAIGLLVAGLRGERRMLLIYAGLGTLFLVIAKLFLVDLAAVDPLWRVLLFLGFGGALLMLSYYFQNAMRGGPKGGGIHLWRWR